MRKNRGLVWLTGILMVAVFALSSLAGWLVWQRQSVHGGLNGTEETLAASLSDGQGSEWGEDSRGSDDSRREEDTKGQGDSGIGGDIGDGGNAGSEGNLRSQGDSGSEGKIGSEGNQAEETVVDPASLKTDITLLFAGDVYFSDYVLQAYDRAGGIQGVLDDGIRQEIDQADMFMVNQEFPFTDWGTAAEDKQFTFRLPSEKVSILQEMKVDLVTLANNHILDFGQDGLLDSCQTLDEAGIHYVGGGENLDRARQLVTIDAGGRTIGFLGTCRVYMDASWAAGPSHPGVFSTYDPAQAIEAIRAAKEQCDYLVVYVHWGVERETEPKEYQKTMGRQYIDAGADLVVGSHPHVLQNIEYYHGKPIVYSMGNFVFGSSILKTALLKLVLKADWEPGANGMDEGTTPGGIEEHVELSLIPCTSSNGYTRIK